MDALQDERKIYQEQMDMVLQQLADDPENPELANLRDELKQLMEVIDEALAEILPPPAQPLTSETPPQHSTSETPPQHSTSETAPPPPPAHVTASVPSPATKAAEPRPAPTSTPAAPEQQPPTPPPSYKINDTVLARWAMGDRDFYPARVVSITGSTAAPIYVVKFKNYNTTETLRVKDIKPFTSTPVLEATTTSLSSSVHPPTTSMATTLPTTETTTTHASPTGGGQPGKRDAVSASLTPLDGDAKPKKKKKPSFETGKNKWQEFSKNTKLGGGKIKKESMFRTPEGIHGRVGFTGSGQAMRKDYTRTRHVYDTADE